VEVVGRDSEVVLTAHGEGGPSIRLVEDTVTINRIHDLRKDFLHIATAVIFESKLVIEYVIV
jgi:hypothetical protein